LGRRIPKLQASAALKPFIQQNDEVATINNLQTASPPVFGSTEKPVPGAAKSSGKEKVFLVFSLLSCPYLAAMM
jgi:hypothetical protein